MKETRKNQKGSIIMANQTTTEQATRRVTKAEHFADIKSILMGETPENGSTIEEAIKFVDNELKLIAQKNAKRTEKSAEDKEKNEAYKDMILDYIATHPDGVTCSDLRNNIEAFFKFSTSQMSLLTTQLVKEGRINKMPAKKGRVPYVLA